MNNEETKILEQPEETKVINQPVEKHSEYNKGEKPKAEEQKMATESKKKTSTAEKVAYAAGGFGQGRSEVRGVLRLGCQAVSRPSGCASGL